MLLIQAVSFGLCQMACVFKARINPQFHRPGNLKEVAGFKLLTELDPYKCRSKCPTTSTFSFNRLSKSNVKSTYDSLRNMMFVATTRRAPVNSIGWLARWWSSRKEAIFTYHWWEWHTASLCVWRLYVELTKNTSSQSQLSYEVEKKNSRVTYLNWKGNTKEHTEEAL